MNSSHGWQSTGFTLLELTVAMTVMVIATLGALNYQYYAAEHARISSAELAGTRIAQLLLEDWKSKGGNEHYNPADLELGFVAANSKEKADYYIEVDDVVMYVDLSYQDIDKDEAANVILRRITAKVRWRADHESGPPLSNDRSVKLTTYVRLDSGA